MIGFTESSDGTERRSGGSVSFGTFSDSFLHAVRLSLRKGNEISVKRPITSSQRRLDLLGLTAFSALLLEAERGEFGSKFRLFFGVWV